MKRLGFVLAGALAIGAATQPIASAAAAPAAPRTAAVGDPSNVFTPERGRGAWSSSGNGGTLSADGLRPGSYFRHRAGAYRNPGATGLDAVTNGTPISVNEYAVHRAVVAIQVRLNDLGFKGANGLPLVVTGRWNAHVDHATKKFQTSKGLPSEGVFGKMTSRAMFSPMVAAAAAAEDPTHKATLERVMLGTISWESNWDPAAVGVISPDDLGLGQINAPAHPSMNMNARLDPKQSLPYIAKLIESNLVAFGYRVDESIAAYNLGQGGARSWIRAGKPQHWPAGSTNDVYRYIDRILNPL